jgi:hypothetical protein
MVLIKEDTIKKGNSNYLKEIESGPCINKMVSFNRKRVLCTTEKFHEGRFYGPRAKTH